jgi:hypothetical protein
VQERENFHESKKEKKENKKMRKRKKNRHLNVRIEQPDEP